LVIVRRIFAFTFFISVIAGLVVRFQSIQPDPLAVNMVSLKVLRGFQKDSALLAQVLPDLTRLVGQDCRLNWMLGDVLKRLGDEAGKKAAWMRLLACHKVDVGMLIPAGRHDEDLARLIVELYPTNPTALFSLAYMVYDEKNPAEALQLFEEGVLYDPSEGMAWCYIGSVYRSDNQFEMALNAYINCCHYGDPGAPGGCYNSGRMLERLGDPRKAIEYYRLSDWEGASERIAELEKQLQP